jgi:hypothetical protein
MTTIGTYTTRVAAERAIEELKARGIGDAEISYMYTNVDGKVTDGNTGNNIENGVASGATTGAVIGAIAGLVVAAGVIPGLGARSALLVPLPQLWLEPSLDLQQEVSSADW